jgi:hypothetical protein
MLLPWVTPDQILAAPGANSDGQGGSGWLSPDIASNPEMLSLICCAASENLYRLTGRQFAEGGIARIQPTVINRDCGCAPWWMASWGGWGSAWSLWQGWGAGGYAWNGCNCASSAEFVFPTSVVISGVTVNGTLLRPGIDYTLLNKRRLVRMASTTPPPAPNSPQVWPCCQDLRQPALSDGRWFVDYAWGKRLPADGRIAAFAYAVEIAKALSGSESDLPQRVINIARQGVTAIAADPLTFIEKGLTGLPLVDLFIVASNPFGLRRRASFISPDSVAPEESPLYQEWYNFDQPVIS